MPRPFYRQNFHFTPPQENRHPDGPEYAAGDLITLTGDGYSLINTMNVTFNGSIVSSHLNAGSSIDILNKLEYSAAYAAGPATQSIFYPHSTKDSSDTDNSFFNKRALTKEANTPDITLQLNRYPFFQSFKNHVSPLGKVGIEITLENDNDLIELLQLMKGELLLHQ